MAAQPRRREVLGLGGAALADTAPFGWAPVQVQGFNWKRFEGKELLGKTEG